MMMGYQKVNLLDLLSEFNTQKGAAAHFPCNSLFFTLMHIFSSAYCWQIGQNLRQSGSSHVSLIPQICTREDGFSPTPR